MLALGSRRAPVSWIRVRRGAGNDHRLAFWDSVV